MNGHRLDGWKGGTAQYIRLYYQVPAYRRGRVIFDGKPGTIVGFRNAALRVRLDSDPKHIITCHPTWRVEYKERTGQ